VSQSSARAFFQLTHSFRQSYEVFEIYPDQPDAQLVSIARLSILSEHGLDFTSVAGNRLVLLYGPLIKIWDFVTNAWASWNAGETSHQVIFGAAAVSIEYTY
jgi:hypothetical protein